MRYYVLVSALVLSLVAPGCVIVFNHDHDHHHHHRHMHCEYHHHDGNCETMMVEGKVTCVCHHCEDHRHQDGKACPAPAPSPAPMAPKAAAPKASVK